MVDSRMRFASRYACTLVILLRFAPSGKLGRELALPVAKPSMPCFGGPDLDTLLVTSIVQAGSEDDALAGAVLLVRPGVRGVADVACAW